MKEKEKTTKKKENVESEDSEYVELVDDSLQDEEVDVGDTMEDEQQAKQEKDIFN
jgi:hypothetical protein